MTNLIRNAQKTRRMTRWFLSAFLAVVIVALPILSVFWMALSGSFDQWSHLMSTTLPRQLMMSIGLMFGVGGLAGLVGAVCAWLISHYKFPLSGILAWGLLLPLAVPAYVGAYALVDFLEYAGPVQSTLRQWFGWTTSRDYWFPEIRSPQAAILVLAMALYPYVYLMGLIAFRDQQGRVDSVGKSLGAGGKKRFFRLSMPLARPALAAGIAVVMMETVNDFGVVDYFAVQTLTTSIFSLWLINHNIAAAAQISCLLIIMMAGLVTLEKHQRRKLKYYSSARNLNLPNRIRLTGTKSFGALFICSTPVVLGFVLPISVLFSHAFGRFDLWLDGELLRALWNSVFVSASAALIAVFVALVLVFAATVLRQDAIKRLLPVTALGYAVPGAVLGVGLLIPLAVFDHVMADMLEWALGLNMGLLLTGSSFAIILAYVVRFFALAIGSIESAITRISPNISAAGRTLGISQLTVMWRIYLPMIWGAITSAMLLIFVDGIKELPATLLLRPFFFETLATRVHEQASLENLGDAAPGAILISLTGLIAVLLLARSNRIK